MWLLVRFEVLIGHKSVQEFKGIYSIDHISKLQNDVWSWWEGQGVNFMHCVKEEGKYCALALPTMHHFGD